jgi:flagellar basal body-associated protein FliL
MADEKNKKDGKEAEAAKSEAAPKKSKLPLLVGGGAAALLVCAYMFASMAVPKKHVVPQLQGPLVAKLSNSELQVNLAGEGSKRYLVMSLTAEYVAYDEAFVKARTGAGGKPGDEDPQYAAMLTDSLLRLASMRTREEVTDPVLIDALLEEIREEIDPVLFPVVIGDAKKANEADHESGLKPGESIHMATMRGLLHQHRLVVDTHSKTIRLDAGPDVRYSGDERDLKVVDQDGNTVYVDVTGVQKGFVGEVAVGAPGKLRRVLREKLLVQ